VRPKINRQGEFDFHPSNLQITNEYYERYEAISRTLDENPRILNLVHEDLKEALETTTSSDGQGGEFQYTSDMVLRIVVCQIIEGLTFRQTVVRIDDSYFLRRFVRIHNGPMMDYTTLCKLRNAISPKTWKKVNKELARHAVKSELIDGEQLRIDTTAVETNIHPPTDSWSLWDTYRVMARLIERARDIDPAVVGDRRLQTRKAKRLQTKIARKASKRPGSEEALRPLYRSLVELTMNICMWGEDVRQGLLENCGKGRWDASEKATAAVLAEELEHYGHLGLRIIDQASRRVLDGGQVANEEKIFSIFEPHTELLKRGKAAKPIEYGHMIQIQQVEDKFITDYEVFEKRPVEHKLLEPAIDSHKALFGAYPESVSADKGYYENMAAIKRLEKKVSMLSIAKKGKRTEKETMRERDPDFRLAQRFRAGIEGTISYLKRILGLFRCFNKGWEHFESTVGATIFAHNLIILGRA